MRTFGFKGLLLAVAYAVTYAVLREASVIHWMLPAGLRFAALLYLPYRLWPAVIVGDLAGSAYHRANALPVYGVPWACVAFFGPIVSAAVPAFALRAGGWAKDPTKLAASASLMLVGGLTASVMSAATGVWGLQLIHYGGALKPMPEGSLHYLSVFTVGDYLGILVIAPILFSNLPRGRLQQLWDHSVNGTPAAAYAWGVCICSAFLGLLWNTAVTSDSHEVQMLARTAMLAPVIIMTFQFGWFGAAPMVFLGNVAMQATMESVGAPDLVDVQLLMGLVGSAMLILGAMATESKSRIHQLARQSEKRLDLARTNLRWGEMRSLQSAAILESAYVDFDSVRSGPALLEQNSPSERAQLRWATGVALRRDLDRHVESLRMSAVHLQGLRMALLVGPIATILREAGVELSVRVTGDTRSIPDDVNIVTYRVIHEFIMRLVRDHSSRRVRVRLIAARDARGSIAVVVKARRGQKPAPAVPPPYATSYEIQSIAETYQGIFHDRSKRQHPTLALLLRDR